MSKGYDLLNLDQDHNQKEVANFLQKNKIENVHKIFYDLSKKWDDKCFEHDCIYGKDNQGIKALSVKLSNFNVRENIKHLSIYSTKEVILDKDLVLKGGHFIVVAPVIKIPDHVNIDLSGENGISYGGTDINKAENGVWSCSYNLHVPLYFVDFRASYCSNEKSFDYAILNDDTRKGGTDGIDGLSGTSGKNGGNLTLIAQKYEGIDNLGINVSGGNGGNGQDGGSGGTCDTWYLTAPTKVAGGDGGSGGNAGKGGNMGDVKIYQSKVDITSNYKSIIKQNLGSDGKLGKGGEGGIGWHSNKYYNFLKKAVFSSGQDGIKGKDGIVIEEKIIESKPLSFFQIKDDYIKFITTYMPEAFSYPENYIEVVGDVSEFL